MKKSQATAFLKFHQKAAKAYAQYGKPADAEAARVMAEKIQKELEKRDAE